VTRSFAAGAAVVAVLALVAAATGALVAPPERQAGLAEWARLVPLALALVIVQSAAEELFFRGYLTQALAARCRSPLAWALVPSLAFGALHWDSGSYGADAWLAVVAATVVGLALVDVTATTGNLSAAIGLHAANNVAALLVVAIPGETAALALYVASVDGPRPMRAWFLADIATTVVAWSAWRLALRLRDRRLHSRGGGSI
jgi:membrane protease YdiL (CAAX protease family)